MSDYLNKSAMHLALDLDLLTSADMSLPMRQLPLPLATTRLVEAASAADQAAARQLFARYRQGLASETVRRHDADLALFATFLVAIALPNAPTTFTTDPLAWTGVSWGLVEAWVQWQLQQGYAIGSVNVRLSSLKAYAGLAVRCGTLSPDAYALIKLVKGFRHAEGKRLDSKREQTRTGTKKAEATPIAPAQILQLKQSGDARQRLMFCLLLDHGLRVGEVALLEARHFVRNQLRFYRPKVDKEQRHTLTPDTADAAEIYLMVAPMIGPIFPGTRQLNRLVAAAGDAIGLTPLSPHDCRHAWATRATAAKTPIKALQDAGGWSSPAMPLRYTQSAEIANEGVKLD